MSLGPALRDRPFFFGWAGDWSASRSAFVFDFVFRQVGAQGFVEALDEALGIVIDEIVEIGFEDWTRTRTRRPRRR